MTKPGKTGFTRVKLATVYSWQGLSAAWVNEAAFRQECSIGLIMLPLAFVVGRSAVEIALLIGVLAIVLITELLNSAIEAVVDRVGSEHHELAGRAKDVASAAVFVSLCLAAIVWILIAIDHYYG